MQENSNVIELTPYLPAAAQRPRRSTPRDTLPWFAALVESVVSVGIGICFAVGLVISLVMAL